MEEPEQLKSPIPGLKRGLAPEIRRTALDYPDLSHSQIARKVGCSPANVTGVLKSFLGGKSEDDLRDYQSAKAEIYDAVASRILESITQSDIAKASLLQRVTSVGILHDKAALVRGEATGINVVAFLDVVKAIKEAERQPARQVIDATIVRDSQVIGCQSAGQGDSEAKE